MSFRERMMPLEYVRRLWSAEEEVGLSCCECGAHYQVVVDDLIEIAIDGSVVCECGGLITIPLEVRIGWLI